MPSSWPVTRGAAFAATFEPLDAAIVFVLGGLVPAALRTAERGGTVVPRHSHEHDPVLFLQAAVGERTGRSVANLTRDVAEEFLDVARRVPVKTAVVPYPMERANEALAALREGRLQGAAVLTVRGAMIAEAR